MDTLHITESLCRVGGVETFLHHYLSGDFRSSAASLLDSGRGERWRGLRPNRMAGAYVLRANAKRWVPVVKHIVFHNFAGLSMLGGTIKHERRTLFLHTNSEDVFTLLPRRLPFLDAIVTSGADLKANLLDRFPSLDRAVFAIEYPLNELFFCPLARVPPERLTIGYAGRVETKQKQVHRLANLSNHLLAKGIDFRLEVAGSGSSLDFLRRSIPQHRLRFLGNLSTPKLANAFAAWDFLIICSDYETGPLVAIEAMAAGVMPILPRIPCQASALVAKLGGPLYSHGDMASAADVIVSLLSSREALGTWRWRYQQEVKGRTLASFISDFRGILESIASRQSISRPPAIPTGLSELLPFTLRRWSTDHLR